MLLDVDQLPSNHLVSDLPDQITPGLSRLFRCTSVCALSVSINVKPLKQTWNNKPQRQHQWKLNQNWLRHFLSHGVPNTLTEFGGNPTLRLGETRGPTNRLTFIYTDFSLQ